MTDFTYVIERFDVSGEEEVLIERAALVREGDALVCLVQGSGERSLDVADVPSAIAGDPVLSEVRANQITRITASDAVYDELPFILRVPGDPDDFDPALWSEDMIEEHTTNEGLDRKVSRVAYVNGQRWCAYPTLAGGSRMLIADAVPAMVEMKPLFGSTCPTSSGKVYVSDGWSVLVLTIRLSFDALPAAVTRLMLIVAALPL